METQCRLFSPISVSFPVNFARNKIFPSLSWQSSVSAQKYCTDCPISVSSAVSLSRQPPRGNQYLFPAFTSAACHLPAIIVSNASLDKQLGLIFSPLLSPSISILCWERSVQNTIETRLFPLSIIGGVNMSIGHLKHRRA